MNEPTPEKSCGICHEFKPITAFAKGSASHGRASQCKECQSRVRREKYRIPREGAKQRARCLKNRADRLGLNTAFSPDEYADVELAANVCGYCESVHSEDNPVYLDHYQPLTLGGANCLSNLVPACERCNRAKSDSPPEVFLAWIDRLRAS